MTLNTPESVVAITIDRYNRLVAASEPGRCFVCGRKRRTVNALVMGPNTTGDGGPIAGRGHGVCRPCIKAGEATALR